MLYFLIGAFLISLVEFLIYRTFTDKMPLNRCFYNTLLGNLGSNVTPFKIAHFPLKFYVQHSFGVPFLDTMTGVVKCQVIHSSTSIIIYTTVVSLLASSKEEIIISGKVFPLFLIISLGLFFHVGAFILTVILSFSLGFQKWALRVVSKIIKKFKKSFNDAEFISEKELELKLFREQIVIIVKKFHRYILPMLLYAFYMFFSEGAIYISYLLITSSPFVLSEFFTFYLLTLASYYISNFVPVPGGAGTTEVVFSMIFLGLISNGIIGSVLILWRISTYYLIVIFEVVLLCFLPVFKKNNKLKNAKFSDFVSDRVC
jgi:uncharacterized membrane protein YbhN (UPF0104 family)